MRVRVTVTVSLYADWEAREFHPRLAMGAGQPEAVPGVRGERRSRKGSAGGGSPRDQRPGRHADERRAALRGLRGRPSARWVPACLAELPSVSTVQYSTSY